MSSANIDAMVREAKRAIREGRKAEAQALLLRATDLDQSHEQAWMWLSAVVESIEDQMICLENVLQINPQNADAKRGLDMLRKKAPPPTHKPPSKPNNPFLIEDDEWDIDGNTDFLVDALGTPSKPATESSATSARDLLTEDDPINPPTDPFVAVFDAKDVFDVAYEDDAQPSEPIVPVKAVPQKAPPPADDFDDIGAVDDDIFGDLDEIDAFLADDAPATKQVAKSDKATQKASQPQMDDNQDPSVYFEMIPSNIKSTRIPGIDESYPPMLMPSLMGLVILNIGALALLFLN